jgi:hypothetical protein
MFPPRPIQHTPLVTKATDLKANAVFGPPPGPANAVGSPASNLDYGSTDGAYGYGDMPFGDEGEPVQQGAGGEDARLVGYVIRMTEFNWFAQRTQTWGGTSLVSATFDECRKFLEGACTQLLRQEQTTLASGQLVYKFWNNSYEVAQAAVGEEDGYGD